MNNGHGLGALEDARRKRAAELKQDGYEILSGGQIADLLGRYADASPDLVARRGDQVIIVEFAQRRPNSLLPDGVKASLTGFSEAAEANANWHFEMVWIGENSDVPEERAVEAYARRALDVAKVDEVAGLLMAWAALEGAITRLVEMTPELHERLPRFRRVGLGQLASFGLLESDDFERLNEIRRVRNSVAHGFDAPVSYGMVQVVASMAERLADANYVSVDQMVDWFFENYEDPAEGVPSDSGEGGYQYDLGGPYDAADVLSSQFPDAAQVDIDKAVSLIEGDGHEWVKKGTY